MLGVKHISSCGRATMYKNAKHRRTDRDNPDPAEVRDAAGIDPRGSPEFVRDVKFAVLRGGKEAKNLPQLTRYLNSRTIFNARGYPWTLAALEAFIKHYRPGRPQSN
jgi:hypothetical protein